MLSLKRVDRRLDGIKKVLGERLTRDNEAVLVERGQMGRREESRSSSVRQDSMRSEY